MIAQWRGVVVERGVDADAPAKEVGDAFTRLQRLERDRVSERDLARDMATLGIALAGAGLSVVVVDPADLEGAHANAGDVTTALKLELLREVATRTPADGPRIRLAFWEAPAGIVVDRDGPNTLITSRKPDDLPVFDAALVAEFGRSKVAH